MKVHRLQHGAAKVVFFEQMAELADRSLVGHRLVAEIDPSEVGASAAESYSASSTAGSERLNHC